MQNNVRVEGRLNAIQQLAITGFLFGGDNFSEDVVGVRDELEYDEMQEGYSMTVLLMEPDGHTCTSGVGFYLEGGDVIVFSCKEVIKVGLTNEMIKLFNDAKNKADGQW
jgi:hypothetical protein|tara:strand:- start:4516 stop:4842 length:327 start_codon:yes stop_codon:yes gene_type:complete